MHGQQNIKKNVMYIWQYSCVMMVMSMHNCFLMIKVLVLYDILVCVLKSTNIVVVWFLKTEFKTETEASIY